MATSLAGAAAGAMIGAGGNAAAGSNPERRKTPRGSVPSRPHGGRQRFAPQSGLDLRGHGVLPAPGLPLPDGCISSSIRGSLAPLARSASDDADRSCNRRGEFDEAPVISRDRQGPAKPGDGQPPCRVSGCSASRSQYVAACRRIRPCLYRAFGGRTGGRQERHRRRIAGP